MNLFSVHANSFIYKINMNGILFPKKNQIKEGT